MNWHKYSLDEWLEQFGAWCELTTQKSGDLPDGLHINKIYWLMQSVNPSKSNQRVCYISDDEAMEISNLLQKALRIAPNDGFTIKCLIENKVERKQVKYLMKIYKKSKPTMIKDIDCGRYCLVGLEPRLRLKTA